MPWATPLTEAEIQAALPELPDWRVEDGKLCADFRFKNFVQAFAFMTTVAFAAEAANHHPDWFNAYNRVRITLVTHAADNAITHRDVELAKKISALAASFPR